jgi:Arc/MetJ-type ribon-helix-helix transcriptional regulator
MQLAQKVSISVAPATLRFIDRYASDHAAKGRSAVVTKALQLLQRSEQESYLADAYGQSAEQDRQIAVEFDATLKDGLRYPDSPASASHETW